MSRIRVLGKSCGFGLICLLTLSVLAEDLHAQRRHIVNSGNNRWVGRRNPAMPNPHGNHAMVLDIESDLSGRMWLYEWSEDDEEYAPVGAPYNLTLAGEPPAGSGSENRRERYTFTIADSQGGGHVWVTLVKGRAGGRANQRVLVRYKFATRDDDQDPARNGEKDEKEPCEEPPTDDVLEEEPILDPDMPLP